MSTSVESPLDFSTKTRGVVDTNARSNELFKKNVNSNRQHPLTNFSVETILNNGTIYNLWLYLFHFFILFKIEPPPEMKEVSRRFNSKQEPVVVAENIMPVTLSKPPISCQLDKSAAPLLPAITTPFKWHTYLSETNSKMAPEEAFNHIAQMQTPIIEVNSVFDFLHNGISQYWPCIICAVSRNIIQVRYLGAEPGFEKPNGRFWIDLGDSRMRPRGWGQKHRLVAKLPSDFELIKDITLKDILNEISLSLPMLSNVLIQNAASCCADLFVPGRLLEIQDVCDPVAFWFVRVLRNYCGRLCLQYVTVPEHDTLPALAASPDLRNLNPQHSPVWLYSSSRRLRPVGWSRDHNCCYKVPAGLRIVGSSFAISKSVLDCSSLRVNQLAFKTRPPMIKHSFQTGDTVEWLHPSRKFFCPAVVSRVVDEEHFVISCSLVDGQFSTGNVQTSSDGECFRKGFSVNNKLAIRNTQGNLSETWIPKKANESTDEDDDNNDEIGFVIGQKLEMVLPESPELVTVATVVRIVAKQILVIQVDVNKDVYLFPIHSHDLFPVGFAEMARHPMTLLPSLQSNKTQVTLTEKSSANGVVAPSQRRQLTMSSPPHDAPQSSPSEIATLHFSQKCYCGKLFSKSKIALLPPKLGPSDVLSVVKEALTYLLNAAHRPVRVLKRLHVKTAKFCRRENTGYSQQPLKTRYQGRLYKATTVLCSTKANLPSFLRKLSSILGICPGLLHCTIEGDQKLSEKPACTSNCRKNVVKPTTRRAAAQAASGTGSNGHHERSANSNKFSKLSVVVQHDSSGGPPSNATSDSRSPGISVSMEELIGRLPLSTNPLRWSVEDVAQFLQFHECSEIAQHLMDQVCLSFHYRHHHRYY